MITIVFIGWVILGFGLFFVLPPRRALLVGLVFPYLFLPYAGTEIWGIRSRDAIICLPLLLGSVLFGGKAWRRAKFCFADLAMAAWCISPFLSSFNNGLGLYNSSALANFQVLNWGVPYLLGRIFFSRLEDLRELAIAIFVGGLIYVPFCLWEIRMSPHLHVWVYGFNPHQFAQTIRYGGFRPTVFLGHGITVAIWLAFAALTGFWLWSSRSLRAFGRVPTGPFLAVLVSTLVLCKTLGALALFATGALLKMGSRTIRSSVLIWLLLAVPTIYVMVRLEGMVSTTTLSSISSKAMDPDRTGSVTFRWMNEELFVKKALEQPMLGWGGWGGWRIRDRVGNDIAVSDALWTIAFGKYGFFGLVSLALVFCLPVLSFLRRYPSRVWAHPRVAPAAALAIFTALSQIDSLFNDPDLAIVMLAAGGIAAAASAPLRHMRRQRVVGAWHAIERPHAQTPG
jgi:hypothetical protein